MSIEIEMEAAEAVITMLDSLSEEKAGRAIKAAAKRAATAARTEGSKRLRKIYTMRASDVKARTQIKADSNGSTLLIRGPVERVEKYKAKERAAGIFVTIKRGNGGIVPRSFSYDGNFIARKGKARYPLKGLYGPSVPQLFGNAEILDAMQERGAEVMERRLEHEIDRMLGGN